MLDKTIVYQALLDRLTGELEVVSAAAQDAFDIAINAEHQAKSKYETFSLESSYLARGQAKRVQELRDALEQLNLLKLRDFSANDPVAVGALVCLNDGSGDVRWLFIAPAGGGEEVAVDDQSVLMMTPTSLLGRAVLGKRLGEQVAVGPKQQRFKLVALS